MYNNPAEQFLTEVFVSKHDDLTYSIWMTQSPEFPDSGSSLRGSLKVILEEIEYHEYDLTEINWCDPITINGVTLAQPWLDYSCINKMTASDWLKEIEEAE